VLSKIYIPSICDEFYIVLVATKFTHVYTLYVMKECTCNSSVFGHTHSVSGSWLTHTAAPHRRTSVCEHL